MQRFSKTKLRVARKAAGYNCDRLAHQLGTTAQSVKYWEYGHRVPAVEMVCRVANLLGVEVGDLFERVEPTDEGGQ